MHDLAQSAEDIAGLDAETRQAIEQYAASPHGGKEWIFSTRQRFIANYTEAGQKALEWAAKQSPPSSSARSGEIQVGGRKGRIVKLSELNQETA